MNAKRRLNDAILSAPLAVKLMSALLGLALLVLTVLYWQLHRTWQAAALRDLEQRGAFLARHEAGEIAPWVRHGDLAALRRYGQEEADYSSPEVYSLQVLDGGGRVLVDSHPAKPGEPVRTVTVPLGNGAEGFIRVAMLESHVTKEVNWITRRLMAVISGFAVLAFLAAWWLTRQITRPMQELVDATGALKGGDFGAMAPVHAMDEVGRLAEAFNDMARTLAQKDAHCRLLLRQVVGAAEEERRRVARELHDQTGQTLTVLIAGLNALEAGRSTRSVGDLRTLAQQAYEEVHDLSRTLRPYALDALGLMPALKDHCERFSRSAGVRVDCDVIGMDYNVRLPGEIEITLYRIVQEALSNAVRHGQARAAQVLLQRRNGHVLAVIEDNGRGFDARLRSAQPPDGNHLGLLGIEERAALLGGRFRVESRPGAGTSLFVEIPVGAYAHA